jgi:hypothetical protein
MNSFLPRRKAEEGGHEEEKKRNREREHAGFERAV